MATRKDGRIDKVDFAALEHFLGGSAEPPKGVGAVKISNLLSKGWIIRSESMADFDPPRYSITQKGRDAYFAEEAIRSNGLTNGDGGFCEPLE